MTYPSDLSAARVCSLRCYGPPDPLCSYVLRLATQDKYEDYTTTLLITYMYTCALTDAGFAPLS